MWAAAEGHAETMTMLIEAGADVNARSTIIAWERQRTAEPRDKWLPPGGLTPLLFAAREGRVDAAKVLLAAGADVSIVDPDRHTPLILALINGHFDVADLLIDHGADVNMHDKVGQTALWAAVDFHTLPQSNRPAPNPFDEETTSLDVIKKLLAHGARVDAALHRADCPTAPSSIAAPTACSAPAPRRCCARPRPATHRSSSCCSRRARTRRR